MNVAKFANARLPELERFLDLLGPLRSTSRPRRAYRRPSSSNVLTDGSDSNTNFKKRQRKEVAQYVLQKRDRWWRRRLTKASRSRMIRRRLEVRSGIQQFDKSRSTRRYAWLAASHRYSCRRFSLVQVRVDKAKRDDKETSLFLGFRVPFTPCRKRFRFLWRRLQGQSSRQVRQRQGEEVTKTKVAACPSGALTDLSFCTILTATAAVPSPCERVEAALGAQLHARVKVLQSFTAPCSRAQTWLHCRLVDSSSWVPFLILVHTAPKVSHVTLVAPPGWDSDFRALFGVLVAESLNTEAKVWTSTMQEDTSARIPLLLEVSAKSSVATLQQLGDLQKAASRWCEENNKGGEVLHHSAFLDPGWSQCPLASLWVLVWWQPAQKASSFSPCGLLNLFLGYNQDSGLQSSTALKCFFVGLDERWRLQQGFGVPARRLLVTGEVQENTSVLPPEDGTPFTYPVTLQIDGVCAEWMKGADSSRVLCMGEAGSTRALGVLRCRTDVAYSFDQGRMVATALIDPQVLRQLVQKHMKLATEEAKAEQGSAWSGRSVPPPSSVPVQVDLRAGAKEPKLAAASLRLLERLPLAFF